METSVTFPRKYMERERYLSAQMNEMRALVFRANQWNASVKNDLSAQINGNRAILFRANEWKPSDTFPRKGTERERYTYLSAVTQRTDRCRVLVVSSVVG